MSSPLLSCIYNDIDTCANTLHVIADRLDGAETMDDIDQKRVRDSIFLVVNHLREKILPNIGVCMVKYDPLELDEELEHSEQKN